MTIKWSKSGTPYVTAFSPWLAKVWIVASDKNVNVRVLLGVFLLFNRRNTGKSSIDSVPTKASCIQNFYTWVYLNLKISSPTFLTVKKKWLAKIPCTEREHISHQRGSSEHHLSKGPFWGDMLVPRKVSSIATSHNLSHGKNLRSPNMAAVLMPADTPVEKAWESLDFPICKEVNHILSGKTSW